MGLPAGKFTQCRACQMCAYSGEFYRDPRMSPAYNLHTIIRTGLGISDSEGRVEFLPFLLDLAVKVAADGLLGPRLIVEVGVSLLLRITNHVRHRLQVSGLRDEPLVDKELRVLGKAEIELAVSLHRVDRLNCLVNLVVQTLDFLLRGCGKEEAVHLCLESVVDLDVDV